MGFLEDLVRSIQEAAEEARHGQRQNRSGPAWSVPVERRQATIVRRVREETPAPVVPPVAQTAAPMPPVSRRSPPPTASAVRIYATLMRQNSTLRKALVISELLQTPLSIRKGLVRSRRRR